MGGPLSEDHAIGRGLRGFAAGALTNANENRDALTIML
jgi:hypothetical protein